jgi:hypothetical protein
MWEKMSSDRAEIPISDDQATFFGWDVKDG